MKDFDKLDFGDIYIINDRGLGMSIYNKSDNKKLCIFNEFGCRELMLFLTRKFMPIGAEEQNDKFVYDIHQK